MANDLNSCNFIGRAGRDPEFKTLPSGKTLVKFSLAVGRKFKDVDETEWVNCTAFDKLAEIISQYVKKGSQIYVRGRMKTDKYQKDGKDVYSTGIIVDEMQLLGGKPDGAKPSDGYSASPSRAAPAQASVDDDDVPF